MAIHTPHVLFAQGQISAARLRQNDAADALPSIDPAGAPQLAARPAQLISFANGDPRRPRLDGNDPPAHMPVRPAPAVCRCGEYVSE